MAGYFLETITHAQAKTAISYNWTEKLIGTNINKTMCVI